jgi:hypothetical protein
VNNACPIPTLELHYGNSALLLANDDWKDQQQTAIEQTGIPPNDSLESAIVADLSSGAYTAIVATEDDAAGVGLIELYDRTYCRPPEVGNCPAPESTGATVGISGLDNNLSVTVE